LPTNFPEIHPGSERARRLPTPTSVRGRIERGIADLSGVALSDLPQTREEVEEIGKIVGPNAVILLAKDATETAFKKEPLDQFRVLHLAVHGFADTQYPERSALVLGTEFYDENIRPRLARMSSSAIASRIGVSRWYSGRIREGYRPHPRHWLALAELASVLPDLQDRPGQSN
jgi:hypothetical protein